MLDWLPMFSRCAVLVCGAMLAGCTNETGEDAGTVPTARLTGMLLDPQLNEISGLAASAQHPDVLWVHDDGGNPERLFAISTGGRRLATLRIDGVTKTDWEDMAAFEFEGRRYLLVADTGDNGGLRRTLQLHVIEEPTTLVNARLTPAWSIAFRWPDGARDCEAVAVDAARGQILLVSKKRQPAELFSLPLRPPAGRVVTATAIGPLAGMPQPEAESPPRSPRRMRLDRYVTAAAVSPDGRTLAVMTYRYLLLYPRRRGERWASAVARQPETRELPWLPQAEALDWSPDGNSLYATGEFIPAPLYRITR